MAKGSDLMLVYGKNVLYEIDRSKIKKAYISRNDYMAYLKENNLGRAAFLPISAIKGGKSIDTSMGLTPLGGLPMVTRSGDLDPSVITYIM